MLANVVVLFEDDRARLQSMQFCDALIERFWTRCEFQLKWWSFDLLKPGQTLEAAENARNADLIIFASHGEPPPEIRAWIDGWIHERADREGAFGKVDLPHQHIYLRHLAHRAGMDYLTELPQTLSWCIPDSVDSYHERAGQMTSVLSDILRKTPPRSVHAL